MALLQISEPGQSPLPQQHKRVVGIDFGTTNSLVATIQDDVATTITDDRGNHFLPSVVHYHAETEGGITVGNDAEKFITTDTFNTITSVKRLIGRDEKELKPLGNKCFYRFYTTQDGGMPYIQTCQGNISPVQVSAEILRTLRNRAETTLQGELEGAVITVPAYFNDAQRQAIKDAATLAGIHVLRLLNEPTAAAIAYGLDQNQQDQERLIAVYDLGGGTFDISILKRTKGVFKVLATGGDSALGGDDIDYNIARWVLDQSDLSTGEPDELSLRQLSRLTRQAKEALTEEEVTTIAYRGKQISLTRKQLHELTEPVVQKTLTACRRAFRDANISSDQIDAVVLVGGSTKMPYIQQQVEQLTGKKPLTSVDPDKVVAMGAAQQAHLLAGNQTADNDILLLDIVPLSLGLETMGELMEKVILRNSTIPLIKTREFTTGKDNQTGMVIHVLQGERELIKDNRSLGRFVLRNIPPMPAGMARICVTFQVDADGLLKVTAREKTTNICADIEVKPAYGLSDDEMKQMLIDAQVRAEADKHNRALREQQIEAEQLLEMLKTALQQDGKKLLSDPQKQEIEQEMASLQMKKTQTDSADELRSAIKKLQQLSEEFAMKRMNVSMHNMLSGHSVDEFKE